MVQPVIRGLIFGGVVGMGPKVYKCCHGWGTFPKKEKLARSGDRGWLPLSQYIGGCYRNSGTIGLLDVHACSMESLSNTAPAAINRTRNHSIATPNRGRLVSRQRPKHTKIAGF